MSLVLILTVLASTSDPTLIDVTPKRDRITVMSDGAGHFLAYERLEHGPPETFYYGDGATLHLLMASMGSGNNDVGEVSFNDPRFDWNKRPFVESSDGWKTALVHCGSRTTELKALASDASADLTARAVFKRQPYAFQPYALARDDMGTYYYVDKGRFEDNEKVFNVYVGPRGAMKLQKLTNIVHDSKGDIFSTANGQLRLIVGTKAEWIVKAKRDELTELPVRDNIMMIFNDLGAYKQLRFGQPCDDL